jgi:hypothetical protein
MSCEKNSQVPDPFLRPLARYMMTEDRRRDCLRGKPAEAGIAPAGIFSVTSGGHSSIAARNKNQLRGRDTHHSTDMRTDKERRRADMEHSRKPDAGAEEDASEAPAHAVRNLKAERIETLAGCVRSKPEYPD